MTISHRIKLNSLFSFFLLVFGCVVFLSLPSCKKDPTSLIGKDLQPDDEFIHTLFCDDTTALNLITYSVLDCPTITSGKSSYALGSYNDATFGTLTTNLITQIFEYSSSDSVKDIFTIDSAVLYLVYGSSYPYQEDGAVLDPVTISIGELAEPELIDSTTLSKTYYSNQDRAVKNPGAVLMNYTFTPNLRDSVIDPDDSAANIHQPVIRIPINMDYAWKLMRASQKGLSTNEFLQEITGLYFKAHPEQSPNKGTVVNFDFNSNYGNPGITVYYRKSFDDTASSTKNYILNFGGSMVYNYIDIDRSTASPDLTNQLDGDTALGQKKLFLQSFFGPVIRVQMPDIREFSKIANGKRIAINQASLVMNVESQTKFNPAAAVNIGYRGVAGSDSIIQLADYPYYGGTFNEAKSEYRVYLTRHIQNLLLDSTTYVVPPPLTIFSNTRQSLPDMTTIYGPDKSNGDKRMRLEVVYSVLP